MVKLTLDQKVFITQRLACYESISSVVAYVKEEFDIELSRQAVQCYNPEKHQGRDLSEDLKTIFYETRKKFLDDSTAIPIANKSVRLAMLQRMADRAEQTKNAVLCASLLEQAAKEVGEAYTNRQKLEHTSPDGSMTPITHTMTPQEAAEAYAAAINAK